MKCDVLILGLNSNAIICSLMLSKMGFDVICIGEKNKKDDDFLQSLSASSINLYENIGLLEKLEQGNCFYKNGISFGAKQNYRYFNYSEKSSRGKGYAYNITQIEFKKILLQKAQECDIKMIVDGEIKELDIKKNKISVELIEDKTNIKIEASFLVDATAKTLTKAFDEEFKSIFEPQLTFYTRIKIKINDMFYDPKKLLIVPNKEWRATWFFLAPYAKDEAFFGVVGTNESLKISEDKKEIIDYYLAKTMRLSDWLKDAEVIDEIKSLNKEFKMPKKLYGPNYLILPCSDGFLNPLFFNGSCFDNYCSKLAAVAIRKILMGKKCDLEDDYEDEVKDGLKVFESFINNFYNGFLVDVLFDELSVDISHYLGSILAGYIFDKSNPYVNKPKARIRFLYETYLVNASKED